MRPVMPDGKTPRQVVQFGIFDLDLGMHELRRDGVRVKLQDQPFQILVFLIERGGVAVTREELRQKLWPSDTFVDFDHGLNTAVKKLREALDDSADNPRFVQTIPRLGYRFIAPTAHSGRSQMAGPLLKVDSPAKTASQKVTSARHALWGRLSWIIPAAVAILVIAAYFLRQRLERPTSSQNERIMLAVLPFENLGQDPNQEYFSDGLTEETITDLGQMNSNRLGVIARTSAMTYKGKSLSIAQIGRELGVDYILEGSVRKEGDRLRINAQLIRVNDQTQIWAHSYESPLRDILAVQGRIGQALSDAVRLELSPAQKAHLTNTPDLNLEAFDAYLRGRYFLNELKPPSIRKGIEYFEEAIHIDPRDALPYAGLAYAYAMLPITTDVPSGDSFHRAKAAAAQSVSLDNTLAEAHVALCAVDFWYEWDWPRAEEECRKAIALNPNYALAHMRYAHVLSNEGRHAEAFQEIERARLLDPSSHITNTNKGFFLYQARQYDLGVEQLRKALEFDPSFWVAHVDLCKAYEQVRMYDSGLSECRKAWELSSGNTEAISLKAHILAAQGKVPEARKELQYLKRLAGTKYVPPYNVALIYAGLGEKDPSLEWLEKAYQEHDVHLVFLLVDAKWDALRGEPRFQNLLHRMGLGQ